MTKWQYVWRNGIAPQLNYEQLISLKQGLINDDVCLIQGSTCFPPMLESTKDHEVQATCAIAYCGWKTGLQKVREIEKFFLTICDTTDSNINEVAGIRHFTNWFDDTPRAEMRDNLIKEINICLNGYL